MEERRINLREATSADIIESIEERQLCFKINNTMPMTEEYDTLVARLFIAGFGEGSRIAQPVNVVRAKNVTIGNNVVIMFNVLMMAAGGITIDDDVLVAANAQLISNNHDYANHHVLTCKPVHLKRNCWIGAGATILPGVTVGENAVVAAGAIVTHDVPDNTMVAGVPARVIKSLTASE